MILVILAAGRGKRLGEKTKNLPKCLIDINIINQYGRSKKNVFGTKK